MTGIIKWVTVATLYCSSMLWPPAQSVTGLVFSLVFSCLSSLTLYHFTSALARGPGFLPLHWSPDNEQDCDQLQFCGQCQGYKAPRSHHCRRCNRCVMKMDHHCPWINTCVGHFNHAHFIMFLGSAVAGCSMATVCLSMSLYYGLNRTWYMYYGTGHEPQVILTLWSLLGALFGMGLALGVVIAVGMLLFFQVRKQFFFRYPINHFLCRSKQYLRIRQGLRIGSKKRLTSDCGTQTVHSCGLMTWVE